MASTGGRPSLWSVTLLLLVFLQWGLITFLLIHRTQPTVSNKPTECLSSSLIASKRLSSTSSSTTLISRSTAGSTSAASSDLHSLPYKGVVATVIFKSPRWFLLRYTLLLHNALVNMPSDWHLQVFVNSRWARDNLWAWHPGMQRLKDNNHPRVTFIDLPERLTTRTTKPKMVLMDEWFWQSMLADNVLLISGNSVFCANHDMILPVNTTTTATTATIWDQLNELDYMGAPTTQFYGQGGEGSTVSFRNRKAMLSVLEYAKQTNVDLLQRQTGNFFLDQMIKMNHKNVASFRIATKQQTELFAGTRNIANETGIIHIPLVVAGTQQKLSWDERESLLKHCPELKMIFPSMHEPACFGAHPKPEQCKASICALQENIPSSGC